MAAVAVVLPVGIQSRGPEPPSIRATLRLMNDTSLQPQHHHTLLRERRYKRA
jgi:hypothetical protein